MKKIGMIGGLSWVSTAAYYQRVNEIMQEARGGVASADLVLASVNRQEYVDAVIERGDEAAASRIIRRAAESIAAAGADFIVITCNDVHRFVPELAPDLDIPFLHIAEVTAGAIKDRGLKRVALLGVRKTMEGRFYPDILGENGIETIIPNEQEKAYIHDTIFDELVQNRFEDATRDGYKRVIADLADRGAEGVILGCTEIPLLLGPEDLDQPSFATTELHCRAAVERALAS